MKKLTITALLLAWGIFLFAQGIYNDGAHIVSTSGSYWVVDNGGFTLTSLSASNLAQMANLTIMDDASLTLTPTSFLSVTGTLSNQSGNDGLVLDASTTASASLKQSSESVSATVKREFASWSSNHGWHFVSSPVGDQEISPGFVDINGAISDQVDFYRWSEPLDLWVNIKNLSSVYNQGSGEAYFSNEVSPVFVTGKGYLAAYASNTTKSFEGNLNNNSVDVSGLSKTEAAGFSGWNLVGNPFPCAIQWGLGTWSLNNVDDICQIYNEAQASYTVVSSGNDIIPSMNGFMVHASVDGASLTIPTDAQVHDATEWYKGTQAYTNGIVLRANDPEGQTSQTSVIRFNPEATPGYDSHFDSYFLAGYAPLFYSIVQEENYALNTLPEQTQDLVIPMGFVKNGSSDFYIELTQNMNDLQVYLIDKKMELVQKLNEGTYHFSSEENDDPDRFEIRFGIVGMEEPTSTPSFIQLWSNQNTIYMLNINQLEGKVSVINMYGQKVLETRLNREANQQINLDAPTGYYIVNVLTKNGVVNKKVYLK
jgi:hypothetical protein